MANVRVNEIARELDVKSKVLIDFLNENGFEVKSHSSNIDDAAQEIIRKKFPGKANNAAPAKEPESAPKAENAAPEKEASKKDVKADAEAKPKKNLTVVINRENSKMSKGRGRNDNRGRDRNRPRNRRGDEGEGSLRPGYSHAGDRVVKRAPKPEQNTQANHVEPKKEPVKHEAKPAAPKRPNDAMKLENAMKRPDVKIHGNIFDNMKQEKKNEERSDKNHGDARRDSKAKSDSKGSKFSGDNSSRQDGAARQNDARRGGKKNTNKKNYEQPKKQERYVNLEKHGGKKKNKPQPKTPEIDENVIRTLTLPDYITIKDLADKIKIQPSALVKKLFMQGTVVTINQEIEFDMAEELALEYNCICEHEVKVDVIEELLREEEEDESLMTPRPPVVCVMGHVDHGKTSLLDAIRETHVTDKEAGGITQHIGASVATINGQKITFLDTPGHEAFTAMRMRGANSTDIAILVVAADDGVMPQTVEAINHAKAAGVEIIVAINKIDKPSANVERVKQELSEYELIPEDWGGSTVFVPVSAHTHEGIDNLLEMILLTADVLELKANADRAARGLVIEARLEKGRGVVATVLVQKGTLHVGDPIAAGSCYGKVRAMTDDQGRRVKVATPSTPVEIQGLSAAPNAGEIFVAMESEKEARSFADTFVSQNKERLIEESKVKMSLDDLFTKIKEGNLKELDIIVKADVQGSVEAVKQSLEKLSNEEVVVKVIHGGVGAINESDIILASASNAIVIGFNVRPDPIAKQTADTEGVDVRLYKVIYNAIEDVEAAMKGMLDPVFEEKIIGHAEVRQIFKASGIGNIAGSYVLDGFFERDCKVRITREGEQIFEGNLASLKRFKDDVKEVKAGYECGLVIEDFNDIAVEDVIEAYKMVEVPR